ncbi:WecB/TagA/CpsF family glycosyltransferase [Paenibacillus piri]|uniref:N-acetylglucosaminyldiphosphoundecaprenol N-acetyl-beta-D-mannosaminyltransferase n=1 Tax=Paenibacillus piri TaxID=2547395 RepID=A0A4R5KPA1_9BACL|nr:WecB/TagA/CpsF family glycosyltransferase [Paenibacillus piri]TDF97533.1 glycosyltransferase [Paenibacillus piri]
MQQQTVSIMGVPFSKLNLQQTLEKLANRIDKQDDGLFHLITANPEIVMMAGQDDELKSIIGRAGMITADGIGVVMAAKWQGEPLEERVTGFDIFTGLLKSGNEKGYSVYLLGADEETNRKSAEVIAKQYPGVRIVGRQNGFFGKDEEAGVVAAIREAKPDILVVAMGAPYSEKWIYRYKSELQAKIAFGIGGSLDVLAGKVKRAPVIWQNLHLEWLYRLLAQPSRWRRQLVLPKFALRVLFGRGR